ncbi:hypothetical protein P7H20_10600 [Paenibacillus larvae]|nr:hypothetical protein [Paenibacillus larvae]MDT2275199.1 hypothetical protein [Paenibacillus larvae]
MLGIIGIIVGGEFKQVGKIAGKATELEAKANKITKSMVTETKGTPKVAGRGQSKGGHQPTNLKERLAMEEAMSNPAAGKTLEGKNTDPRWPASEGWVKKRKMLMVLRCIINTIRKLEK